MPLNIKLDTLDNLPEALHDLYEKRDDGAFHLMPPDGFVSADDLEDTSGLKSALQKERDAARTAAQKVKALEGKLAGIDPDKYKELLDKEADAETKRLEQAGEWTKMKEQMTVQHSADLQKEREISARLTRQLETVQIDSKVIEAISKAGGNVELLKPHVRSRLLLNTDDFSTTVLDTDGKTPKVDGNGNPVNIDALISEMRKSDIYSGAFKASEQSGSGSEPSKGGSGANGNNGGKPLLNGDLRLSTMTDRQKIDFQKAHGIDKLLELPQ